MTSIGTTSTVDYSELYKYYQSQNNSTNPFADVISANQSGNTYIVKSTSNNDEVVLSSQETNNTTAKDESDDGKIGLWGAVKNMGKGVCKSICSGIKGMFTNKEGNFSVGKTLLTAAATAACIAFPAVGLVACGIGAVMGGVQLGKGVVNVAKADTDAEAEQAWQDIGGGSFTVASSLVGAKASVKAVKSSSTAGLSGLDDAAAAIAKADGKTSALSQLDDSANLAQKGIALAKDMRSSTANRGSAIKDTAISLGKYAKSQKAEKSVTKAMNKAENKPTQANFDKAQEKINAASEAFDDYYNSNGYDTAKDIVNTKNEIKANITEKIKSKFQKNKTADTTTSTVAETATNRAESAENATKVKLSEKIKTKWNNTIEKAKNLPKDTYNEMTTKAQSAFEFLTSNEGKYAEAVQKFGYDAVYEAMSVAYGYSEANDAV